MFSRFLSSLTVTLTVLLVAPSAAHAVDVPDEPVLSFTGGGWGHGVGMSQHGALGRALDGHTHGEILGFYYDGTQRVAASSLGLAADDIDVLVAVRSSVTLAPPDAQPWQLALAIDDAAFAVADRPVTVSFDGALWHANIVVDGVGSDLCGTGCPGSVFSAALFAGSRIVVDGVGQYAHGRVELVPQGAVTPTGPATTCGSQANHEFCVVNGGLALSHYLYGIQEVPSSWPVAALRAQAVAARTFALSRMRVSLPEYDLLATTSDQVYTGWGMEQHCAAGGGWCAAVDATAGEVLTHGGRLIQAVYSSSNGGHTASNSDVWGSAPLPFLRAKPDPYDAVPANPNAAWEHTYTIADISRWLADLGVGQVVRIRLENVPGSGFVDRATAVIEGTEATVEITGYELWSALNRGCRGDAGCDPLIGRNFSIEAFLDVPANAYFAVPVAWMTAHEITTGLDANTFAPQKANTRGELVTFLHRFADLPTADVATSFVDVKANAFYEQAVGWAVDTGVTLGITSEIFLPYGVITRAQAATMLWRFAGAPEPSVLNPFGDVNGAEYYADAVRWMVEWGITRGTTDTTFSPGQLLTRAEIATFLWRLAGTPGAFADDVTLLPSSMRVS